MAASAPSNANKLERQAAIDPSRYEPYPKRRIDEGQLLLGNTVVDVLDVVHAVLSRAVAEARRFAGGPFRVQSCGGWDARRPRPPRAGEASFPR